MDHEQRPSRPIRVDSAENPLRPGYSRDALQRSITHIGVGGFHRSHFAQYIHRVCALGYSNWGIVGVGVLEGDRLMAEALRNQDCLYTLVTRDSEETTTTVIGSIVDYIHAYPDPQPLIDQISAPETQILSLTLTESGYPVDLATGTYQSHQDKKAVNAFDIVTAGLKQRSTEGNGPLTILSFDNILGNGDVTRTATLGAAQPDLKNWINKNVTFPNSMVDRITVQTTDLDREWLRAEHGLLDAWPVKAEPFSQWVVEDNFGGDRLPLEELDVIVTDDVHPYEQMKLRLLNASHSSMAYIAALESINFVDKAMAQPWISSYLANFLRHEATPSLDQVKAVDLDDYCARLISRFENPQIGDQITRLCIDGSAKFRTFLLDTIRFNLEHNGPICHAVMALAAWCEYLSDGIRRHGFDASDHLAHDANMSQILQRADKSLDEPLLFLNDNDTFEDYFTSNARFCEQFVDSVKAIREFGVHQAVVNMLENQQSNE